MNSATNSIKDFEVVHVPNDSVSALEFSPPTLEKNFLVAGSWDNSVRCWKVELNGKTEPITMQSMTMPILDISWIDDGTKVFNASCDKQVTCWDLGSNQTAVVAQHNAPVNTCHWIKTPSYSCLMTSSWDKTLKFWDLRSANPIMTINLPGKSICADVDYPMAVIGTDSKNLSVFKLDYQPTFLKNINEPFKYQLRSIALFKDKKNQSPIGFALGNIEGRIAINYFQSKTDNDNFVFKCHRHFNTGYQDVYAINDIKFHPIHGTFATVGSDATYSFWDLETRSKIKTSEVFEQPITKCCFNKNGQIFAYSTGYDWSKGHEFNNPNKKPQIFLRPCFEELKSKSTF